MTMRRIILILIFGLLGLTAAQARTYRPGEIPNVQRLDARRYVSDPDGILTADELTAELTALREKQERKAKKEKACH